MEQIGRLPPPLREIEIPQQLSVTRLATSGTCLLRAVAPRFGLPRALSGPRAEFGKVVHALTQLAATERLGINGIPKDPEEAFEHLLAETASRLASNGETRPFANLSVGFTPREWEKRRFFAITRAKTLAKVQLPRSHVESSFPRGESLSLARVLERNIPIAAEIPFESTALRIRGRLDLIAVEPLGHVSITDFKSGNVTDADGVPGEETSLQLRLYGLAIRELAPGKEVSLHVVSRDGESLVPADDEVNEATSEWLRVRRERLPAGSQVQAEELAVVGPHCRRCDIRPVRPAYRSSAGMLWKRTDQATELPLDIAGTVLGSETDRDGYLSIKLTDLAERVVKVHRLNPRSGWESALTSRHILWFFDLASIEARMQKTGWRQPRNFHEVAAMTTERTAWTLRLFID
jgi:PD-(D/E)XK nuclease superfamily